METCAAELAELPVALARYHAALAPGTRLRVILSGRTVTAERARFLLHGGGFARGRLSPGERGLAVAATRARTLPDWVGPGMRLLICGLNPSLCSAAAGIPFARRGNRFWPALCTAALVERERDVEQAFARGIGFTDLVKRATAAAAEVTAREYERGVRRVGELVGLYRPRVVCFVGLEGWRRAIDKNAAPGWVPEGFAGARAYLMPSTSGRNASASLAALSAHLRRAVELATNQPRSQETLHG